MRERAALELPTYFYWLLGAFIVIGVVVLIPVMTPAIALALLVYGISLRRRSSDRNARRLATWAIVVGIALLVLSAVVLSGLAFNTGGSGGGGFESSRGHRLG